ncbi:Rhodanese-related sulfurtransferase [Tenacibaculum sp. MAR_2010_89]|uniref:rhodanese-like domain-containing protein n=1 Tax=Tenacibaculum sp. MAR_2010_89 TaxID=1250198 RepID=UPI00089D1495|nr:rhodanese-like domain-containing protein [Tenacibaculum sp. MAR_2010_89]SEE10600.1 Rhodanese-related sulfurtransferase [Tenacibaculum sp. MAR_2010_89]
MKFINSILIITVLFLTGCKGQSKEIKNITTSTLETVLKSDSRIQLVDVRTPAEWQKGIIENAIKIDVTSSSFEKEALNLLDKTKPVYLYCRSGGRSMIAAETLLKKGFEVYNIEGGYMQWQQKTN